MMKGLGTTKNWEELRLLVVIVLLESVDHHFTLLKIFKFFQMYYFCNEQPILPKRDLCHEYSSILLYSIPKQHHGCCNEQIFYFSY